MILQNKYEIYENNSCCILLNTEVSWNSLNKHLIISPLFTYLSYYILYINLIYENNFRNDSINEP